MMILCSCSEWNYSQSFDTGIDISLASSVSESPINLSSDPNRLYVAGSCEVENSIIEFRINEEDAPSISGDILCINGRFEGEIDISNLADGDNHELYTFIKNAKGKEFKSNPIRITKDTIAPTTSTVTPVSIVPSNVSSYTVSGACSENGEVRVTLLPYQRKVACENGSFRAYPKTSACLNAIIAKAKWHKAS